MEGLGDSGWMGIPKREPHVLVCLLNRSIDVDLEPFEQLYPKLSIGTFGIGLHNYGELIGDLQKRPIELLNR